MLLLWPSLLLTLHCTFLTWPVTYLRPVFPRASDNLEQPSKEKIESNKQDFLKAVNRSDSPIKTFLKDPYILANFYRLAPVASQATASKNVVSFNLSSCVSTQVLDVENAFLAFYVHATQQFLDPVMKIRRPGWDRMNERIYNLKKKNALLKIRLQKCKKKFKRLNTSADKQIDTTGSSYQPDTFSNSGNSISTPDRPENSALDRPSDSSASADVSRFRHVNVVVRAMNTTSSRKRTIYVSQIQVKPGMSIVRVSVPVEHLRRTADTEDRVLSLQIVCKDCDKNVWIERVYTRQRRNGKKTKPGEKTLNINRPILYIDMKNGTCRQTLLNSLTQELDTPTTE